MGVLIKLYDHAEAEKLVKAKLKIRPLASQENNCEVEIMDVVKVEQPGLRIFPGILYKDQERGVMFSASDPDNQGRSKIRMIT